MAKGLRPASLCAGALPLEYDAGDCGIHTAPRGKISWWINIKNCMPTRLPLASVDWGRSEYMHVIKNYGLDLCFEGAYQLK